MSRNYLPFRLLIVDDNQALCHQLAAIFEPENWFIQKSNTGSDAMEVLRKSVFDLVLLDLHLPHISGFTILKDIQNRTLPTKVIIFSANSSPSQAADTIKMGAVDYIEKSGSIDLIDIRTRIKTQHDSIMDDQRKLLSGGGSHATRGRGRGFNKAVETVVADSEMIGQSEALEKVKKQITKLAKKGISILITGENGTGKELVARSIHNQSERANGPFIAINCGGVQATLLESLLFGSKRGSYTGSEQHEIGLIRAANKGTLFLDEIGNISNEMQMALLRVLESKKVLPVGETKEVDLDIRLITATNRNLKAAVAEGSFREDFYRRIKQIEVRVPSLNERKEDIPMLVDFFLEYWCEKEKLEPCTFAEGVMEKLVNHNWTGNIRHLSSCIYALVCLTDENEISVETLIEYFENE